MIDDSGWKVWLRNHPLLFSMTRRLLYGSRLVYGRVYGLLNSKRDLQAYLDSHNSRKLHVGCGDFLLDGWLNTDAFPRRGSVSWCDATAKFPFPECTFDFVFTEHMIEHVSFIQARAMLREAFRVLKPGGRIRISTPDLEKIVALLASSLPEIQAQYVNWAISNIPEALPGRASFVVNSMMRDWGHVFLYDPGTLKALLEQCGFVDVASHAVGESDEPELRGVEAHGRIFPNPQFNVVESMVLEAGKPSAEA